MNTSHTSRTLLLALAKSARAFADAIEQGDAAPEVAEPATQGPVLYDPRTQDPPIKADPTGTTDQKNMAYLTYVGALALINDSEKRGATPNEVRKYAMKAGYANGAAVNGFARGDHAAVTVKDDGRWVTDNGHKWIPDLEMALDVHLPQPEDSE